MKCPCCGEVDACIIDDQKTCSNFVTDRNMVCDSGDRTRQLDFFGETVVIFTGRDPPPPTGHPVIVFEEDGPFEVVEESRMLTFTLDSDISLP